MTPQTEVDHYVFQQLQPLLQPGESILHCAYLAPVLGESSGAGVFAQAATRMAAFAALTDRRLVLVRTRIGAFKPLLENHGFQSFDRTSLKGVFVGSVLLLHLADGQMLEYENNAAKKYASTQSTFFEELPRVFGVSEEAARSAKRSKLTSSIALGVGCLVAAVYVWLKFD